MSAESDPEERVMGVGDYAAELEFAKALAIEAAEQARARRRSDRIPPEEKSNRSYVTAVDRDIERLLRGRIAERFGADQITGEEYAAAGGSGPRRWSIDPIDGTGNFVHDLPLWAISIGLMDAGEPVLGVIAVPPLGELFWATRGGGAWKDGAAIHSSDGETFHPQDNVSVGTNALRALDPRTLPGRLRDLGSACCEQVFTAMGRMAAATFLGEQTHDVAAGAVITWEAGCRIGTIDGRLLSPSEFVAETPVRVPTFVAAPKRLALLMAQARRLA